MRPEPCMDWIEELEAAADERPSTELAAHLATCEGCREEMRVLRRVAGALGALAMEDPGMDFSAAVVQRLERSPSTSWLAPAALLLAGGAGGSAALAAVCVVGLWLWLGTERIVTALGFIAADVSGMVSTLLDPLPVPELASVGIGLAIVAAMAGAMVALAKMTSATRGLTPR
ncbi:MAG: hypothetical protein GF320_19355 [Armatimonadia bacterium]|nr:hypothetical protein [Armatimonadia bacterium]